MNQQRGLSTDITKLRFWNFASPLEVCLLACPATSKREDNSQVESLEIVARKSREGLQHKGLGLVNKRT